MFHPYFSLTLTQTLIVGDKKILIEMLPQLIKYHSQIRDASFDPVQGLYINKDLRDGMESSIGKCYLVLVQWEGERDNTYLVINTIF